MICARLSVLALAVAGASCTLHSETVGEPTGVSVHALSASDMVVASDQVDRPSGRYTILKVMGEDGNVRGLILDEQGREFTDRKDAVPIGIDLDLSLVNSSGSVVVSSTSSYNPYEIVSYCTAKGGFFPLWINRFSNNDSISDLSIGLVVARQ